LTSWLAFRIAGWQDGRQLLGTGQLAVVTPNGQLANWQTGGAAAGAAHTNTEQTQTRTLFELATWSALV